MCGGWGCQGLQNPALQSIFTLVITSEHARVHSRTHHALLTRGGLDAVMSAHTDTPVAPQSRVSGVGLGVAGGAEQHGHAGGLVTVYSPPYLYLPILPRAPRRRMSPDGLLPPSRPRVCTGSATAAQTGLFPTTVYPHSNVASTTIPLCTRRFFPLSLSALPGR